MFRINSKTNKISMTKGDTAIFFVGKQDLEGKVIQYLPSDQITFTVMDVSTKEVVLTKQSKDGVIRFVPEDTKDLDCKIYYYDIQLTSGNGIFTIIPTSYFEIEMEVSQ